MCKPILLVISVLFINANMGVDMSDREDGFYLTAACAPGEKPLPVVLTDGKKTVCLPSKPVVGFSGVISISGLVNLPKENQTAFRMVLSEEAVQKLRRISSQLPTNVYAFVFRDEVAFTFEIDVKKFNQIIEVKGNMESKEIKILHQRLEKALRDGS
jgi:hypothetical protein